MQLSTICILASIEYENEYSFLKEAAMHGPHIYQEMTQFYGMIHKMQATKVGFSNEKKECWLNDADKYWKTWQISHF